MRFFVLFIPVWLFGTIFPPTVDTPNMDFVQFLTLIWLPMIATIFGEWQFLLGPVFRERPLIFFLTCTSLLAIAASALMSTNPARSLGYVAAAAVGLVCSAGLWRLIGNRMIDCLSLYAVLGSAFATYIFFEGPRIQGRLSISLTSHPNHLGLVAFGPLMCSLLVRSRVIAACMIAINFVIIAAAESRSSLIAAFLGILVYLTLKTTRGRKRKSTLVLIGTAIASAILAVIYQDAIEEWVSSLLFLNDKYRGLGTGFTGRLNAWQEAYDLFRGSPWFGVGFRMHEQYMTTLSSAHNGYLSLLAEVGVVGTVAFMALTLFASWRLLLRALRGDSLAIFGLSFVVGFLFLATFERFFVNTGGNPTSILTWLFLMMPETASRNIAAHVPVDRGSQRAFLVPNKAY
jgi:O-antigen ligase